MTSTGATGRAWSGVLMLMSALGCMRTHYNVASQHQDYTLTSTEREVEIGRRVAHHLIEEETVVADTPMQERVRAIGERLVAVCDRREILYQFTVIDDKEVNAFSLPGGYVFLHEGLVKKAVNDDELAAVIAHEIAHIAARHAVKRYESGLGAQLLQLGTMAASRRGDAARSLSMAMQAARLAYARKDELEADRLAITYLKAAGFNPEGMLAFLEKLDELHDERPHYLPRGVTRVHYAMTHPFITDRLRHAKEQLYGVADYIDYLNEPE